MMVPLTVPPPSPAGLTVTVRVAGVVVPDAGFTVSQFPFEVANAAKFSESPLLESTIVWGAAVVGCAEDDDLKPADSSSQSRICDAQRQS